MTRRVADADLKAHEALPEGVRQYYSPIEYAWLSDAEKATLVERECEPEF